MTTATLLGTDHVYYGGKSTVAAIVDEVRRNLARVPNIL